VSVDRDSRDLAIRIGHDELVIRRRYETASIANDVVTGLLFLVGSVLFFSDSTMVAGTWLFVVGSVLMLVRPSIRLTRRVHLTRRRGGDRHGAHESSMDF
jgi:YrhK-like protein